MSRVLSQILGQAVHRVGFAAGTRLMSPTTSILPVTKPPVIAEFGESEKVRLAKINPIGIQAETALYLE